MIYFLFAAIPIALVLILRVGYRSPWWSPRDDQRLIDLWTVTHYGHGLVLYSCMRLVSGWTDSDVTSMGIVGFSVVLEFLWELWENSQAGIRQQHGWGFHRYSGDSVFNSLLDWIACVLGALTLAWFW